MTTLITLALAAAISAAMPVDPDSTTTVLSDSLKVSTVMLRDVEIVADNVRSIPDGIAAVPTQRQRRAATGTGGEGLLKHMQPPMLVIDPKRKNITMDTGEEVAYFINGVEASGSDIADLRTRNVQRVDILRHPSDPKYHGVAAAVNFVVKEPDYGGYVTAAAQQRFGADNMGRYYLYGRYVHGAHTLQARAEFTPVNHHGSLTDTRNIYHMTRADGTPYELERRESSTQTAWHQRRYTGGLQWNWRGKSAYVISSAGITYEDNPRIDSEGTVAYNLPDAAPQAMIFRSWSHYCVPYWNIRANFTLPRNNVMYVSAAVSLSDNNSGSSYEANDLTAPLINNTDETGVATTLKFYYGHTFKGGNKIETELNGTPKFYNVRYSGTASQHNRLRQDYYEASAKYTHRLSKTWRAIAEASLSYMGVSVRDGVSNSDITPDFSLNVNGRIRSKHVLAFSGNLYTIPRRIGSFNNVDQSINEIEGKGGNEYLKRESTVGATGSYTWLLAKWINLGTTARWDRIIDHVVQDYIQKGNMMYNTMVNSGALDHLSLSLRSTVNLLDRKLTLSPQVMTDHYIQEGVYPYNFWNVNGWLSAYYYPNDNMSCGVSVMSPSKMIGTGSGAVVDRRSWDCYIEGSYTTDDLMLTLTVNPFHRYERERDYFSGKNISSLTNSLLTNGGRFVEVAVSYTFDYGRKVQRSSEMMIRNERTSSTR